MLRLFDYLSIKIARLFKRNRIEKYKVTYVLLEQGVQVLSVFVTAAIFGVFIQFMLLFWIYVFVRLTRVPIHLNDYYECFRWSYSYFLSTIVCLFVIDQYYSLFITFICSAIFGILGGFNFSKNKKFHNNEDS